MINYSNTNIKGYQGKAITVHEDFVLYMDKMNESAKRLGLTVYVTNSIRTPDDKLSGVVFTPAKMSPHYIGHAVDLNLQSRKQWFNGDAMKREYESRLGKVYSFIQECKSFGLRYGGDFHPDRNGRTDNVHFDSGIHVRNPERWHEIYDSLQK